MRLILLLMSLTTSPSLFAQDDLDGRLAQLRKSSPGEVESEVDAFLGSSPDRDRVLERLRAGVLPAPDASLTAGWSVREAPGTAGETYPYQLYLSESALSSTTPLALLVHMHGAVSRPNYSRSPGDVGYGRSLWVDAANERGFVLVCPLGKTGYEWWKANGAHAVEAAIRDVKRLLPVHDDRVVATGFSDGASGCYFLAMTAPDRFAAFVPMNGQPMVPGVASGRRLHPRNLASVPMYVLGTRDDSLYPMVAVLPHFEPALLIGGKLRIVSWERGDHQPSYFGELRESILGYISSSERTRQLERVRWRFDVPSRVDMVELIEMGGESSEGAQVMRSEGRVVLGVTLDPDVTNGVRVMTVAADSAAAWVGIEAGDRILRFDKTPIESRADLTQILRSKRHGDAVAVKLNRGTETLQLLNRLPRFRPTPVYRRDLPGAEVDLRVETEGWTLDTVGVKKLRLHWNRAGAPPARISLNRTWTPLTWSERSLRDVLIEYSRIGDARAVVTHVAIVEP